MSSIDNKQIYAPVLIPTMCRYEHLKRCIDSLGANALALNTELYIGIDYPPAEQYVEGWKKVIHYVENELPEFASVHIYIHEENKGAENNALFVLEKARESYDRFIFTEDDNEFSKNYLEYCNYMLDEFEDDERIVAISGFEYPIEHRMKDDKVYTNDVYFSAFGYASWFDRFDAMLDSLDVRWLNETYSDSRFMRA